MAETWGVWDRANLMWVGGVMSESDARSTAAHWNATYGTIYYVARSRFARPCCACPGS